MTRRIAKALCLIEDVAQNRGVNLLLFTDEGDALVWLRRSGPDAADDRVDHPGR